MNMQTLKSTILPEEVMFFKNNNRKESDPIKKEIFEFPKLVYIMRNVYPFPLNLNKYYEIKYNSIEEKRLLLILALNYLEYRNNNEINKARPITVKPSELYYTMEFIRYFYEYNNPVKDFNKENTIWIFPKYKIREFISQCIIEEKYEEMFIKDSTITKLIMIMTGFTKHEYENADNNISDQISVLNYPTLVLANINLYERGYLRLSQEESGIAITLNLSPMESVNRIFTKDMNWIKDKIIFVINEIENSKYTIKDFLN